MDRKPLDVIEDVDPIYELDFIGPRERAWGEWIVQLTDVASNQLRSLSMVDSLLDSGVNDFTVIGGLGSEGLVLVRGIGASQAGIEGSLRQSEHVETFSLNSVIEGQTTVPNDSDFNRVIDWLGKNQRFGGMGSEPWQQSRGGRRGGLGRRCDSPRSLSQYLDQSGRDS